MINDELTNECGTCFETIMNYIMCSEDCIDYKICLENCLIYNLFQWVLFIILILYPSVWFIDYFMYRGFRYGSEEEKEQKKKKKKKRRKKLK